MIAIFAIALLAAQAPEPDWQPYPMEGGVAHFDRNSVLDNGRYRSIAVRFDVDRDGVASYVTRFEVNCADRQFRVRNVAAYDAAGRELLNHRIGESAFAGPGSGNRLVDAACNHPSPRPDPTPADAPSTHARAVATICTEAAAERRAGNSAWLDRYADTLAFTDEQRADLRRSCEAFDIGAGN